MKKMLKREKGQTHIVPNRFLELSFIRIHGFDGANAIHCNSNLKFRKRNMKNCSN